MQERSVKYSVCASGSVRTEERGDDGVVFMAKAGREVCVFVCVNLL